MGSIESSTKQCECYNDYCVTTICQNKSKIKMSSGFVSEKELAEARLKRQQEWEKVRTADQPIEAPEEKYDSRSLFERLDEQRKKRDLEFEESRKLKNMIKGLDDDEIDFLDLVDQKKLEAERNKTIDEERELVDYRNRVAALQEQRAIKTTQQQRTTPTANPSRMSQNQLLKGIVITKKRSAEEVPLEETKKLKTQPVLNCIGILPGIGGYHSDDSSSDAESSDLEDVVFPKIKYDLAGRKIEENKQDET